jgi:predicted nucleotidyltransferase
MRTRENCLEQPPLAEHLETIRALCREFGVKRLEVLGSVCTDDFDPSQSDIDFLVEYPEEYEFGPWIKRFFDLQDRLAEAMGRSVDLVMVSALQNRWFKLEANKTRTTIYDEAQVAEVA